MPYHSLQSEFDLEDVLVFYRGEDGKSNTVIKRLSDIFRGKVIDVTNNSYVIEMTGASDKLDAFVGALDESSIIETVRSGPTSMSRGENGLHL